MRSPDDDPKGCSDNKKLRKTYTCIVNFIHCCVGGQKFIHMREDDGHHYWWWLRELWCGG
jgi:hypothetical protein